MTDHDAMPSRSEITQRAAVVLASEMSALAVGLPPGSAAILATVGEGIRERYNHRRQRYAATIIEMVGPERFRDAIEDDPELEALFLSTMSTAMAAGLDNKRVYLARVVANAFANDEPIDTAWLKAEVLRDLDGPHIRALTRLRKADDENQAEPGMDDVIFQEALRKEPTPVLAVLTRSGVLRQGSEMRSSGLASLSRAETLSITGVNDFGRELLTDLEGIDTEAGA